MPKTKTKPDRQGSAAPLTNSASRGDVLTLGEAAAYLRLTEEEVVRLVKEQGLPGRQVGGNWRFLKAAVQSWLGCVHVANRAQFWETHFGAFRDDPYLAEIVREAYRNRGRPKDGAI